MTPPLLYPLDEFYERARLQLPFAVPVAGNEVPEPYRGILVHDRDMTPTVEDFYGRGVELRVLDYSLTGEVFSRRIVLTLAGLGTPVVFGAIKIYLAHFPASARSLIVGMQQPLGTILRTQGIEHTSHPAAYFEVSSDALINGALQLAGAHRLYGRRNLLQDSARRTLAQVVEILPPAQ